MSYLLPTFKAVSLIFAVSAVGTGAQAILDPIGFSKSFGLTLNAPIQAKDNGQVQSMKQHRDPTLSYISLMGIRQLATGLILLTFAYQKKWTEMATILAIIGVVVAGTDGLYLSRSGKRSLGVFHALPGVLIAGLSATVAFTSP